MEIKFKKVTLQTKKPVEAINITSQIKKIIMESAIKNGIVSISTIHTTTGLIVTEGLPCLEKDILKILEKLVPEDENYLHNRYLESYGRLAVNAHAHIKSIISGINTFFPIQDGKIVMGGTQTIYFLEFDGPLYRKYCVQIIGE